MDHKNLKAGTRIQFPQWDESPGPTLVIVRVGEDLVYTRSEPTGAVVPRPIRAVLRYGKEVR